ncbi:MAG: LysR family transcriptional regulator [Rhizobiaceae bacterium]
MNSLPPLDVATFVAIVDHGSLRAAAAALDVKPPAVSHRLKRLEEAVGVPLLLRTTRSVELTEAGRRLFERSRSALLEISEAVSDARRTSEVPNGVLRIALSHIAFRYTLHDSLTGFCRRYPEIGLDLSFDDQLVDLARGGFHAGVREGHLLDENMIAVKITKPRRVVHVASPEYLDRMGRPSMPEDLLDHECILYRFGTTSRILEWKFNTPDGPTTIDVKGKISVNDQNARVDATRLGLGIAWFGERVVEREIRNGELEVVLSDFAIERPPFYLYFPREYAKLKILRVLIDHLKSKIDVD